MENYKKKEEIEEKRLAELYKNIPANKFALAHGLIVQAARLRVYLDDLWDDLRRNGFTEMFSQSEKTDPYERERPAARLFTTADKSYQAIIKQLNDLLPEESAADEGFDCD